MNLRLLSREGRIGLALGWLLFVWQTLGTSTVIAKDKEPKIRVFLTLPTRDGFTDAIQSHVDSELDLGHELNHMHEFTPAGNAETADMRLTVLGRDVGNVTYGQFTQARVLPSGLAASAISIPVPIKTLWVAVLLEVGPTYRRVFVGASSTWSGCAAVIAKDLRAWAKLNRDHLKSFQGQ